MRTALFACLVFLVSKGHSQLGQEHRFLYPVSDQNAMAIHDMDGDGDGDVVHNSAGRLWLYEQTAPDTWYVTADLGSVSSARHFRTADIDADGILDLVFLEESPNRIAWLPIGNGGSYGPIQDLINNMPSLIDFRFGDMDGDADLDIVLTTGNPYSIAWCANEGAGSFGAAQVLVAETHPFPPAWNTFALADIDADSDLDLATVTYGEVNVADSLKWFENDGLGSFTPHPVQPCDQGKEVVALDIDGDTDLDLLVLGHTQALDLAVLRFIHGNNDLFAYPTTAFGIDSYIIHDLEPMDADTDGDLDLMFEWVYLDISSAPEVRSLENDGTGDLTLSTMCFPFISDSRKPYALGDINSGSPQDIASTILDGLHMALDGNNASTRLNSLLRPQRIISAQFIGDPLPDVVMMSDFYFGPTMEGTRPLNMALHTNEEGVVREQISDGWQPSSGAPLIEGVPADLDNDGDQDLLALWQEPWTSTWKRWCVFMNNSGSLDSTYTVGDEYFLMQQDGTIPHLGDLDNDGDPDLMWRGMSQETMGITTAENNGDGSFGPATSVFVGTMAHPRAIGLCDVDQDGASDYVWTMQDSLMWAVYDGNGSPMDYQFIGMAPIQADIISTLDMDGNGSEDLVLLSVDSLAFLFNDGNNGFINGELFSYDGWSLQGPFSLNHGLGDLDGNGFPDVVAIGATGDIVYYPNFGNADIGGPLTLITGAEHTGRSDIDLADMDGDGDLDVLTCSTTGAAAWLGNDGMLPTTAPARTTSASWMVFPNPMSDHARLVMPEPLGAGTRIEVVDTGGRVLRTMNGNGTREMLIERGDLESGMYALRLIGPSGSRGAARIMVR